MKRNFILFGFLVSLGFFTYYFEELPSLKKFAQYRSDSQLFNIDVKKLVKLKLPNAVIRRVADEYFSKKNNYIVDERVLLSFFDNLNQIKVIKKLDMKSTDSSYQKFFPQK